MLSPSFVAKMKRMKEGREEIVGKLAWWGG
jgi:hypothetical protein